MHRRNMFIERDDPEAPGLLMRRYARVLVCWEATLGGWGWCLQGAEGNPIGPMKGPFGDGEAAFEAAAETLGGYWEGDEGRLV